MTPPQEQRWQRAAEQYANTVVKNPHLRAGSIVYSEIQKAYVQGRRDEAEEQQKRYNELGVKFDKETERWQERDAQELEKRKDLESELSSLREAVSSLVIVARVKRPNLPLNMQIDPFEYVIKNIDVLRPFVSINEAGATTEPPKPI